MAKQITIESIDDLDGTQAHETIRFALNSASFEIDLSETNAAALRAVLAPYMNAGRKTSATRSKTGISSTSASVRPSKDVTAIRVWARSAGHTVSDRGRVPLEIEQAYAAAHK
jgi:hypothetical protein